MDRPLLQLIPETMPSSTGLASPPFYMKAADAARQKERDYGDPGPVNEPYGSNLYLIQSLRLS